MIKIFSVRKILITSLLLVVALILYSFPKELEQDIDNKYYDTLNIYLIDSNNYVAMTSVLSHVNDINDKVKMIIDSLTVGTSEVKNGFLPIIPKGTKLIDFNIENDLIKINFSKEFLNISLENENKLIESIVFSLTSLEGIEKVMIFVEGKLLNKLPNSHKKLDVYLDRSYGINKIIDINKITGNKMVTVYYLSQSDEVYYIPVSYVLEDNQESIQIIVESLRTNKMNSSYLSSHLDYQVKLMNYEKIDDEFFLNFNDALLSSVYDGKLKEEVKYALSYSILDTYSIENVIFQVNSNKIDELRLAK